ncbi:signal-regulatory protein beta-1-like [Zootoca vivipara]|uniref:signal-regulatory protein beta-1-like n=1 Tax=Zootoca vivipara TaxID=8524 RepID=UPI00293BAF57|nr:signal-regulatory protein beta-1-like [Zootoca vivipara]
MATLGSFSASPHSFLLLLLLLQMLGAKGKDLEVLQPPGPLSVSAGENLILTCTVNRSGPPGGVKWHKGLDRRQTPIYSGRGQSPHRVTRVDPRSPRDFSILIRNIRPEDAGTYYCVKYRAGAHGIEFKSGGGTEVSVIVPRLPSFSPVLSGSSVAACAHRVLAPTRQPPPIHSRESRRGGRDPPSNTDQPTGQSRSSRPAPPPPPTNNTRLSSTDKLREGAECLVSLRSKSQLLPTFLHSSPHPGSHFVTGARPTAHSQNSKYAHWTRKGFPLGSVAGPILQGSPGDVSMLPPAALPSQPSIKGPTSRVLSGTSATFSCTSDGFSPRVIKVTWLKDNTRITSPQPTILPEGDSISYQMLSTVQVPLARDDVKAQLICQIEHKTLPSPLRKVFKLEDILRVPPKMKLEVSPVLLNELVTFSCSAEGFYPEDTTLALTLNSSLSETGTAEPMAQNGDGTFTLRSSLKLNATEDRNQSAFTCLVTQNSQPVATETFVLNIRVPTEGSESVSMEPGHSLLSPFGLCIGLILASKLLVVAPFLLYLFLKKEHGKKNLRNTPVST